MMAIRRWGGCKSDKFDKISDIESGRPNLMVYMQNGHFHHEPMIVLYVKHNTSACIILEFVVAYVVSSADVCSPLEARKGKQSEKSHH